MNTEPDQSGGFVDVRMRGFATRASVAEALAWVDANSAPLASEKIGLANAYQRVLSTDQCATIDVPPFNRAAMDGFAVLAAETNGASSYNPLPFRIVGDARPGAACETPVTPGTAVQIATGAPLPLGADAVVPAEYAQADGKRVEILGTVTPGKHVGAAGEDIRTGDPILSIGRCLRPQDVGLLASTGCERVDVVRRPRVRIVATGNEIVSPGTAPDADQIYDSNSLTLRGLVQRDGGQIESVQICRDEQSAIDSAMTAPGADVVLISGGSSVGPDDFAPSILAEQGELAVHGVAMRPSSPSGMGRIGSCLVFLLPGNPVSCLCAYEFFAGRAIRRLGGRTNDWPHRRRQLPLAEKISSNLGRLDFCRVRIVENQVVPIAVSGASILSSTTLADGFVLVPEACEGLPPGAEVDVYCFDEWEHDQR